MRPCPPVDALVRRPLYLGTNAQHRLKRRLQVATAIEPEHELVEVRLQVPFAHCAMKRALEPLPPPGRGVGLPLPMVPPVVKRIGM